MVSMDNIRIGITGGSIDGLMFVAQHNSELVNDFLDNGANIDEKTPTGDTSLYISICCNNIFMSKFIIQKGADVKLSVMIKHSLCME